MTPSPNQALTERRRKVKRGEYIFYEYIVPALIGLAGGVAGALIATHIASM